MVNSVYYQQAGGGNISTVSRAVVVLGLDAVRSIAITVLLLEHLQNKDNADQLKDEFLRANLAGVLARDIGSKSAGAPGHRAGLHLLDVPQPRPPAEPVLLSRRKRRDQACRCCRKNCSEDAAALQVLGISFEDLGVGIAQTWGFPRLIVNSMRRLPAGSIRRPLNPEDRLRVLSALSNELCTVIADTGSRSAGEGAAPIAMRFGDAVALDEQDLRRRWTSRLSRLRSLPAAST
jgi:HD-like signal output (HDOD) protein